MGSKKRLRSVWLDHGWQPVPVVFAPTKDAWRRTMKHLKSKSPWPFDALHSCGHAMFMLDEPAGKAVIVIAVNEKFIGDDPVELVGTLVHEATHALDWIYERMGEKEPGFEGRAYAMENLVRELLTAYSKTLGKGKSWS